MRALFATFIIFAATVLQGTFAWSSSNEEPSSPTSNPDSVSTEVASSSSPDGSTLDTRQNALPAYADLVTSWNDEEAKALMEAFQESLGQLDKGELGEAMSTLESIVDFANGGKKLSRPCKVVIGAAMCKLAILLERGSMMWLQTEMEAPAVGGDSSFVDTVVDFFGGKIEAIPHRTRKVAMLPEEYGGDPEKRILRAVSLYHHAATFGNETAQYRMGVLHATGALGVEEDQSKAALYYYFSSLGGHPGALLAMGYRHSKGINVPKRCAAAVAYYSSAAQIAVDALEVDGFAALNVRPRINVDTLQEQVSGGDGSWPDEDLVDYYRQAADQGDKHSQLSLGQLYYYGARGAVRDRQVAMHYFRMAAQQGDATAMANMATMLLRGIGSPPDYAAAYSNFSAAAEQGNAGGYNGLGYMELYGLVGDAASTRDDVGEHMAANVPKAVDYFSKPLSKATLRRSITSAAYICLARG